MLKLNLKEVPVLFTQGQTAIVRSIAGGIVFLLRMGGVGEAMSV